MVSCNPSEAHTKSGAMGTVHVGTLTDFTKVDRGARTVEHALAVGRGLRSDTVGFGDLLRNSLLQGCLVVRREAATRR